MIELTQQNFQDEVINSSIPVVVDFWSERCGPCKMLAPILEELSGELMYARIGKACVDTELPLARQYGIRALPTLLFFHNGEVKAQLVGMVTRQKILDTLNSLQ